MIISPNFNVRPEYVAVLSRIRSSIPFRGHNKHNYEM